MGTWFHRGAVALAVVAAGSVCGCVKNSEEMLTLEPGSLQLRQLQTRRFNTTDEKAVLAASAGALQDLGFTIERSKPSVGLIRASKERPAQQPAQVALAVAIVLMGGPAIATDKDQLIRASLVTTPHGAYTTVRVTFQREIHDTANRTTCYEPVAEPAIYQQFFEHLSKAVFLEANEI